MVDNMTAFAVWRMQASLVAHELRERKQKRLAKQILKVADELDTILLMEFGEQYLDKMLELIKVFEQHKHVPHSAQLIPFQPGGPK